jgi:hypothetical protein
MAYWSVPVEGQNYSKLFQSNIPTSSGYASVPLGTDTGSILGASTGPTNPNPNPNPNPVAPPPGPSGEDVLKTELDTIFNPIFAGLQGQETTLNENYGVQQGNVGTQYQAAADTLKSQEESSSTKLAGQETTAGKVKDDALTGATRLYNEISRGGQQRFGGASSAGEAFQTLTAVEQQRRQGTIWDNFQTAMQKVGEFKADLVRRFDEAMIQLKAQKQTALDNLKIQFNDALQAIRTNTRQAESDKATATLNTLQDYRNKIYAINLQNIQWAQTLNTQNQATIQQVDAYTQQVANSISSGQNTLLSFGDTANRAANTTNLGISSGGYNTGTQMTGSRTGRYDENGNWIPA